MKKIIEKIMGKIKQMGLNKLLIPLIVILIIVAVAQGLYSGRGVSSEKAGEIAINYINKALAGQATATLVDKVVKENGVYKLKLKIGEQSMDSYITIDGKLIFPNGIEIKEETATSNNNNNNTTSDIPKKDKTAANLFVMSFCPYGNQAEELMMPVVDLLKNKADIQLHYVIYENYQGGGADYCMSSGKYCSMHGIQEVNQDVRELCVQKYQGDKFWNFVKQINASCTAQNADTCWEGVASKDGIDINKIKTCQKNEAITLLQSEVDLGKKYEISGSPQLVINDKEYTGARTQEGYKTAICSGFNTVPSECSTSLGTNTGTTPSGGCETPQ
jgi:glutaredoxin